MVLLNPSNAALTDITFTVMGLPTGGTDALGNPEYSNTELVVQAIVTPLDRASDPLPGVDVTQPRVKVRAESWPEAVTRQQQPQGRLTYDGKAATITLDPILVNPHVTGLGLSSGTQTTGTIVFDG